MLHFEIMLSISDAIRGQNSYSRALVLHLTIHKCDEVFPPSGFSWILVLSTCCFCTECHRYRKLKFRYFCIHCGPLSLSFGHSFWTVVLGFCSYGSSVVCCLNFKYSWGVTGKYVNWLTETISSKFSFVSCKKALLSVSAKNIVFPGLKTIFKSYFWSVSSIRCSLAGVWCSDFLKIDCSGLWSISSKMYWWNFLHPNDIARVSFSICT